MTYTDLGLNEREARILEARLVRDQTLQAIGLQEEITRERVRQVVVKAVRRARHRLQKKPEILRLAGLGLELVREVHSLRELGARLLWRDPSPAELDQLKRLLRLFGPLDFPPPPAPSPPSAEMIRATILEALGSLEVGSTTLTAILRGRSWGRLGCFRDSPWYGALALCSSAEVEEQVEALLGEGRLVKSTWRTFGRVGSVLRPVGGASAGPPRRTERGTWQCWIAFQVPKTKSSSRATATESNCHLVSLHAPGPKSG